MEIANYMKEHADAGDVIFYDIYTDEEKYAYAQCFGILVENGARYVCMLCGMFRCIRAMDTASLYTRRANKHTRRKLFKDRLHSRSAHIGELPDKLYASGDGKRYAIGNTHVQQTRAFEHPAADIDEHHIRAVRNDMDAARCGSDNAAGVDRHVYENAEKPKIRFISQEAPYRYDTEPLVICK